MSTISIQRFSKTFARGQRALCEVSLEIPSGQMVALIGPSGSGKSTLLRTISGLLVGDRVACCVQVDDVNVQEAGRLARSVRASRRRIGFVFQQFNLVDRLSVLTNVLAGTLGTVPLWRSMLMIFTPAEKRRALQAMERVGIVDHAYKRASQLSGGQQQRAAIARALVQQASVILADEPIASLDPESARRVMALLATINKEDSATVVVSLHQVDFALRYCERVVALRSGEVVFDGPSAEITPEALEQIYGGELEWDATISENASRATPASAPELLQPSAEFA